MPRATDSVPDEKAFAERAAVMRTGCTDREHFIALPGEQDRLGPDMTEQHRTIRKQREIETVGKVGPTRSGCVVGHRSILLDGDLSLRIGMEAAVVLDCPRLIEHRLTLGMQRQRRDGCRWQPS